MNPDDAKQPIRCLRLPKLQQKHFEVNHAEIQLSGDWQLAVHRMTITQNPALTMLVTCSQMPRSIRCGRLTLRRSHYWQPV